MSRDRTKRSCGRSQYIFYFFRKHDHLYGWVFVTEVAGDFPIFARPFNSPFLFCDCFGDDEHTLFPRRTKAIKSSTLHVAYSYFFTSAKTLIPQLLSLRLSTSFQSLPIASHEMFVLEGRKNFTHIPTLVNRVNFSQFNETHKSATLLISPPVICVIHP